MIDLLSILRIILVAIIVAIPVLSALYIISFVMARGFIDSFETFFKTKHNEQKEKNKLSGTDSK